MRTVEKKILNDSFFNFFSPPDIKDDEELDSDTEALLDSDFQIGSCFKVSHTIHLGTKMKDSLNRTISVTPL